MVKKACFIIAVILVIGACSLCAYAVFKHYNNEIIKLQKASSIASDERDEFKDKLEVMQQSLHEEIVKNEQLAQENSELLIQTNNAIEELNEINATLSDLKSEEYELIYLGEYMLTAYCCELYSHICGLGKGITATGTVATPGRTIAVDPNVIPYGSQVYIEGIGWRTAEDTGGAVNNKHIDVVVDTHENASNFGLQHGGVWMLVKKY